MRKKWRIDKQCALEHTGSKNATNIAVSAGRGEGMMICFMGRK